MLSYGNDFLMNMNMSILQYALLVMHSVCVAKNISVHRLTGIMCPKRIKYMYLKIDQKIIAGPSEYAVAVSCTFHSSLFLHINFPNVASCSSYDIRISRIN